MSQVKKDLILGKAKKFLVSFQDSHAYDGTFGQNFYKVYLLYLLYSEQFQSLQLHRVELGDGYPGSVFFMCKIPSFTKNAFNVAHGGALTTYVDIATTAALFAFDDKGRANVSAKLDMEFMTSAAIDQEIEIEAKINKVGKSLAFTEGRLIDPQNKKVICIGTHIKAFINQEYKLRDDVK
eukprot:403366821